MPSASVASRARADPGRSGWPGPRSRSAATGVAARLLDALPSDDAGATELALRAEVDLQLGRYTAAAERAASAIALRPGDRTAQARPGSRPGRAHGADPGLAARAAGRDPPADAGPGPRPAPADELAALSRGRLHGPRPERRALSDRGRPRSADGHPGRVPRERGPPERAPDVGRRRRDLPPPRAGPRPGHPDRPARPGRSRGRPGPRHASSVRRSSTRRPTTSTPRSRWRSASDSGSRSSTRSAASSRRPGGRGPSADVADSDRYRASREVETACMRDADAVVTLSETMRARHPRPRRDRRRTGSSSSRTRVDVERFVPGPRDAGAGRPGRGRRRSGHRLHLELHRLRGDPLPHRGDRRAPPARPARPLPARRRRRGAGRAGGRRDRGRRRRRHGHLHRARPARRGPRLLPADRRLRRPAHERPGLAARHAAQALRGDGDGARPGRERGRSPARDRRGRRNGSIVPTRGSRSTWPTSSSHSSTTRPSASAWARPPGSGSTEQPDLAPERRALPGVVRTPGGGMTDEAPPSPRRRIAYLTYSTGQYDSRTQRMAESAVERGLRGDRLCALGARPAARGRGSRLSHRPRPRRCRSWRSPGCAVAAGGGSRRSGPGPARGGRPAHRGDDRGRPEPELDDGRRLRPARSRHEPSPRPMAAVDGSIGCRGRCAGRSSAGRSGAPGSCPTTSDCGVGGSSCSRSGRWAGRPPWPRSPSRPTCGTGCGPPRCRRSIGCVGSTAAGPSTTAATSTSMPAVSRRMGRGWKWLTRAPRATLGAAGRRDPHRQRCLRPDPGRPVPGRGPTGRPQHATALRPADTAARPDPPATGPARRRPRSSSTRAA